LDARSLSLVFGGPAGGARDGRGQPRQRRANSCWLEQSASGSISTKRIAACEQNQQLIGKNPQLMRISDNSGHQGAVSGVAEADVASLFSEARA
jgi:hypothetical protein